jgi:lysozyme family protein
MSDFQKALEKTLKNEGGYTLENVAGDKGGQTYAGIARNIFPHWDGWGLIDKGDTSSDALKQEVSDFYKTQFWNPIRGDEIIKDEIAFSVFDFAVNAGIKTAVRAAQVAIGETPDGSIGMSTLAALNTADPKEFNVLFALAKIARYAQICNKNRDQSKFLLGWINRALQGVA